MAIAKKRIHMICGMCGCDSMLSYNIKQEYEEPDDNNEEFPIVNVVYLHCDNCGAITCLDEIIEKK